MRFAPLFALLLAAPALHAQADPTPPQDYAPLAVGTVREYRLADQGESTVFGYRRETVVRDTLIGGATWHVVRTQAFATNRTRTADAERLERFDAALANVLRRSADGTTSAVYPCRLDLDLTAAGGFPACRIGVSYSKGAGTVLNVPTTRLALGYDFGTTVVAAGFGLVLTVEEGVFTRLVYSRTPALTAGMPVAGLPFRPDPTPPADYYPLEVGNEWIYRYTERSVLGTSDVYARRRVLREEAAGGQTYAVDQQCVYNNLVAAPTWVCQPERLVRFDAATTNVVGRNSAGGEYIVLCDLGADFDTPFNPSFPCTGYTGGGPAAVEIGGVIYPVPSVKNAVSLANVPPASLVAGIGPAEQPAGDFRTSSFTFARVRGVEYGARPVAGEGGAAPAGTLALAVTPNPTAGALRLALTLPEAGTVRLDAFDALGRRVWQQTSVLGAGAQTFDVDASAWAPGLYVVRAVAGSASASARVVRR